VVLEQDVSLFCFSEFFPVLEFTFCDGVTELLGASFELQHFYSVVVVLDEAAISDDSDGVPLSGRICLCSFCREQVV